MNESSIPTLRAGWRSWCAMLSTIRGIKYNKLFSAETISLIPPFRWLLQKFKKYIWNIEQRKANDKKEIYKNNYVAWLLPYKKEVDNCNWKKNYCI